MGVPQGLLGNGVHSRCSQTGNFTWEVGFKYLEALKNLRQLGFNPQVNRFHLRDGHITGRVVIPELFLGELRGSHLGGGWSLRAAGSLLSMPLKAGRDRGEISWPFSCFFPLCFSKCLSLAKLCWQSVGSGNQANVACRGEERWGVNVWSKYQNTLNMQYVKRWYQLWKDVQQVKGNGERLGVGGPSFAHRRLGDHSELENRYGRELSERRDWGSHASIWEKGF